MEKVVSTTVFRFITVRPFDGKTVSQRIATAQNWRVAILNEPPSVAKNDEATVLRQRKATEYSEYLNAIADLQEHKVLAAARQKVGTENQATTVSWQDALTATTKEFLNEIGLLTGYSLDFVLQRMEQKAAVLLGNLATGVKTSDAVLAVNGSLWSVETAPQGGVANRTAGENAKEAKPNTYLKPLGIADFRRVEQTLKGYELGEIAHIENVLIGEKKEHTTRHTLRLEEMNSVLSESESIKERDSQTTDRFELQKESEKQQQQEASLHLGASITASYGPVKATLSADYSNTNAQQQSDREAVRIAKETTTRALERVTQRVRTERVSKHMEEWEDTSAHSIDNGSGAKHINGVYRWLDKVYDAKIVNYGKRLMLEFVIPEPAAGYLFLQANRPNPTVAVEKPKNPNSQTILSLMPDIIPASAINDQSSSWAKIPLSSHKVIAPTNASFWATAFGVEYEPYPADKLVAVNKTAKVEDDNRLVEAMSIDIPDGYYAYQADIVFLQDKDDSDWAATIVVGNNPPFLVPTTNQPVNWTNHQALRYFTVKYSADSNISVLTLNNETGKLPVLLTGLTKFYGVNIEVACKPTEKAIEEWQLRLYKKIMDSYQLKLQTYEQALKETQSGFGFAGGTNPAANKQMEQQELKRGCLNWLFQTDANAGPVYSNWAVWYWGSNEWNSDTNIPPAMTLAEAQRGGLINAFAENSFEWNLMTYTYSPYFYGAMSRWRKLAQLSDSDLSFQNFLQAGMARVVVPVRPGYEAQVLYFLQTGEIQRSVVPTDDLDAYGQAILNELETDQSDIYETETTLKLADIPAAAARTAEPDQDLTWEVRVPTTLVVLCDGTDLCGANTTPKEVAAQVDAVL